jgi:predicted DNA-binding transcriptional regulator AlpA
MVSEQPAPSSTVRTGGPALEPLHVGGKHAGPFAGVSSATWWRLHAAGKVPAPIRLASRTLWRVSELRAWSEAGCPDRQTWDALRDSAQGRDGKR